MRAPRFSFPPALAATSPRAARYASTTSCCSAARSRSIRPTEFRRRAQPADETERLSQALAFTKAAPCTRRRRDDTPIVGSPLIKSRTPPRVRPRGSHQQVRDQVVGAGRLRMSHQCPARFRIWVRSSRARLVGPLSPVTCAAIGKLLTHVANTLARVAASPAAPAPALRPLSHHLRGQSPRIALS